MSDYHLQLRVRQGRLWKLVHEKFSSVKAFSVACGVSPKSVSDLLNFKTKPTTEASRRFNPFGRGEFVKEYPVEWKPSVLEICAFLGVCADNVFPVHLQHILPSNLAETYSATKVIGMSEESETYCLPEYGEIDDRFRTDAIRDVLSTLTEREAEILSMRFGLDGGGCKTLEEIGNKIKRTRELVRHIEQKALRKLRHPTRMDKLAEFMQ